MDEVQKREFERRLKRIKAGGENTTAQMYIGPAEDPDVVKRQKQLSGIPDVSKTVLYPMSIICAFLVGAFAVIVSRVARFYVLGGELTGELADIWMVVDLVLAITFIIMLGSLFSYRGRIMQVSKTFGIVAMLGLMHNLVHLVPGPFSALFSPEWVREVVSTTQANTILLPGFSIGPQGTKQAAPSLPSLPSNVAPEEILIDEPTVSQAG